MRIEVFNQIPIAETYRSNRVRSMMNVSPEDGATFRRVFDLPIESPKWRIGAVVGPSGTGKSSIGRQVGNLWNQAVAWPGGAELTIYDQLCAEAGDRPSVAEEALAVVGLSNKDTWLRPFHLLSNGEQFRADLAMVLVVAPERVVVDEFTSTIDRELAKRVTRDFSRRWRLLSQDEQAPQFVALACHHDILPWLDPDWALDTNTGEVIVGRRAFYDLGLLVSFGRQIGTMGPVVGALSA